MHDIIHRFVGSAAAGMTLVAALGCSGEPIDQPVADDAQLEEATQELSMNGILEGPLVLQETPLGAWTYEQLSKKWVQWAMKNPWSTGAVTDTTGEACAVGQTGPVWFLAGTEGGHAERSCTVPAFKPIFFPLENYFNTPADQFVDEPAEEANYIAFFTGYFADWRESVCSLTLRVDGEDVLPSLEELDEATWVDVLDPFPVYMNEDNWGGLPEGVRHKALTAGHHALLLLPPGHHTVELGGTLCWDDGETFDVGVVYDLHVML